MTHRGDSDTIRVTWIDDDVGDLVRIGEAERCPGFAGVSGAVDTSAKGQVFAELRFAGTDVDHIGVGRRDGDGAD